MTYEQKELAVIFIIILVGLFFLKEGIQEVKNEAKRIEACNNYSLSTEDYKILCSRK